MRRHSRQHAGGDEPAVELAGRDPHDLIIELAIRRFAAGKRVIDEARVPVEIRRLVYSPESGRGTRRLRAVEVLAGGENDRRDEAAVTQLEEVMGPEADLQMSRSGGWQVSP